MQEHLWKDKILLEKLLSAVLLVSLSFNKIEREAINGASWSTDSGYTSFWGAKRTQNKSTWNRSFWTRSAVIPTCQLSHQLWRTTSVTYTSHCWTRTTQAQRTVRKTTISPLRSTIWLAKPSTELPSSRTQIYEVTLVSLTCSNRTLHAQHVTGQLWKPHRTVT